MANEFNTTLGNLNEYMPFGMYEGAFAYCKANNI